MDDSGVEVLQPGQVIRPKVDKNVAVDLVQRMYGLKVKHIVELNAYDDKNFHVVCKEDFDNPWISEVARDGYVLKVTNSLDSKKTSFVGGQTDLLIFLNENGISCPFPVKNLKNRFYSLEMFEGGTWKHIVRLLTYKPGGILDHVEISDELLADVGQFTAKLDESLKKFHHPAYEEHRTLWMLGAVPKLRDFLYAVKDADKRLIVNEVIDKFEVDVLASLDQLEAGIIHGDINEQNIIVDETGNKVSAVLDLGDSQKSYLIFELAIATCYMILKAKDIARGKYLLEGYQRVRKLPEVEKKILKICVCARLCQSLVLGAYSHLNDPQNEYLLLTQKSGWSLLEKLWPMADEETLRIWELRLDL